VATDSGFVTDHGVTTDCVTAHGSVTTHASVTTYSIVTSGCIITTDARATIYSWGTTDNIAVIFEKAYSTRNQIRVSGIHDSYTTDKAIEATVSPQVKYTGKIACSLHPVGTPTTLLPSQHAHRGA
jgi:hypothetical protein